MLKYIFFSCFRVNFATCTHSNNVCVNVPCNVLPDPEKDTKHKGIYVFYADERYDPNKSKWFYQSSTQRCTMMYTVIHGTYYLLHIILYRITIQYTVMKGAERLIFNSLLFSISNLEWLLDQPRRRRRNIKALDPFDCLRI